MNSLKYVGGPLDGKTLDRRPDHKNWPVRCKGCWTDIKVGDPIGMYCLQSDWTLKWVVPKNGPIKTNESHQVQLARQQTAPRVTWPRPLVTLPPGVEPTHRKIKKD